MTPHPTHRKFRGAFTAIVTPFNADASAIDYGRLDQQLAFQAKGGVTGVIVSGTTGESPTLTHSEYEHLVKACVERGRTHGLMVIAGTGSNSTAHAVDLQRLAASLGADAALSVNPYYNKPTQEGLYRHFMTIADSAELPIMLYNIPGRTGVALTPATVERLSKHPHIRACKEATGSTDSCSEIAQRCPDIAVLSGDDSMTLPFMSVGAVGVVSVITNLVPTKMAGLCKAWLDGNAGAALAAHRELFPLCRACFVETNPIPLKAAMKLLGRDTGAMRLPMTEASAETVTGLKKVLAEMGMV